jgi:glucose/arabinose dehydrogenase
MKKLLLLLCVVFLSSAIAQAQGNAPLDASAIQMNEIANGFNRPLLLTHAGDGSQRLFVVEQGGRIWIIEDDTRVNTPFLDVSSLVSAEANRGGYTERGLLGLAFHPLYAENGLFFVNYTDMDGHSVVARYSVSDDPNVADATSAATILFQEQPYSNHNGGHLAFGPDGYLYIGFGDGGSQGDPLGAGQRLDTLLGKILRIDVNSEDGYSIPDDNPFVNEPDARPEIWAYGLRNPWRFTFDRETGDMFIGDVGGNNWEEISYQPAESTGGENYGWSLVEGMHAQSNTLPDNVTMPILEYSHRDGVSITGGFVYRGEAIPALQGAYLYADFGYGTFWIGWQDESGGWTSDFFMRGTGLTVSSFGEDEAGELYVVDYAGRILRIEPA